MKNILEIFGIRQHTESFRVLWRRDADGVIRITTPFYPGRTPYNFGERKDIPIGATGVCSIEMVIESNPDQPSFGENKI